MASWEFRDGKRGWGEATGNRRRTCLNRRIFYLIRCFHLHPFSWFCRLPIFFIGFGFFEHFFEFCLEVWNYPAPLILIFFCNSRSLSLHRLAPTSSNDSNLSTKYDPSLDPSPRANLVSFQRLSDFSLILAIYFCIGDIPSYIFNFHRFKFYIFVCSSIILFIGFITNFWCLSSIGLIGNSRSYWLLSLFRSCSSLSHFWKRLLCFSRSQGLLRRRVLTRYWRIFMTGLKVFLLVFQAPTFITLLMQNFFRWRYIIC